MHKSQSLFNLIIALHVSGVTITHLQEHKTTASTTSGNNYTVIELNYIPEYGRLSCLRTICPAYLSLVILTVDTKSISSYRRYRRSRVSSVKPTDRFRNHCSSQGKEFGRKQWSLVLPTVRITVFFFLRMKPGKCLWNSGVYSLSWYTRACNDTSE